jgi:hypothetical protein
VSDESDTNIKHGTYCSSELVVPNCRTKIPVAPKLVPEPHTIADLQGTVVRFWKYLSDKGLTAKPILVNYGQCAFRIEIMGNILDDNILVVVAVVSISAILRLVSRKASNYCIIFDHLKAGHE